MNVDGIGMKLIIRRRKGFGVIVCVFLEKIMVKGIIKCEIFRIRMFVLEMRYVVYFFFGVDIYFFIVVLYFFWSREVFVVLFEGKFFKGNVVLGEVIFMYVVFGEGEEVEVDVGFMRFFKVVVFFVRVLIKVEKYSDYGVLIMFNLYFIKDGKYIFKFDVRVMSCLKDEIE